MFYNIGSKQKWASVIFKSFELEVTGNDFFCLFSNSGKSLLHLFFLCNTRVAANKSSLFSRYKSKTHKCTTIYRDK